VWWSGLSARRRLLFALVAAVVLAAAAVIVVVRSGGEARAGVPPQDRLGPVVLVPGYGGNQGSLAELAERVRGTGREARVMALPGNGTGDLLAQVAVLDQEVDAALGSGAPSVDLIGYSAGGVVARLWVARQGGEHRARRVITLGSPLHGTRLASTGGVVAPDACPVACQQLATGSALLASVARAPVPLPWLSIWTENDQTVVPPDSARLDGAVNVAIQSVCPGVHIEHGELPTDPDVARIVLRALETSPISVSC
jgi:triacylglycerol esterase/lipase EstA (alpha/beta hydrolase family)